MGALQKKRWWQFTLAGLAALLCIMLGATHLYAAMAIASVFVGVAIIVGALGA